MLVVLHNLRKAVRSLQKLVGEDQSKPEASAHIKSAQEKLMVIVEPYSKDSAQEAVTKLKSVQTHIKAEIADQPSAPAIRAAKLYRQATLLLKPDKDQFNPKGKSKIVQAYNALADAVEILGGSKVKMQKPTLSGYDVSTYQLEAV